MELISQEKDISLHHLYTVWPLTAEREWRWRKNAVQASKSKPNDPKITTVNPPTLNKSEFHWHDVNVPRAAAHVGTNTDRKLLPHLQENKIAMGFCLHGDACVPYLSERRVCDAVQPGGALVSQVVEDVEGTRRFRASLLVAKNKVNPLMQLTRHKLAFQGLSEDAGQVEVRGTPAACGPDGKKIKLKVAFHFKKSLHCTKCHKPN